MLVEKQEVLDKALDEISQKDPVLPLDEAITATISRTELEKAPEMPEAQRVAVHNILKILSGVCDGAAALDDCGFNKIDTRIGRSLAEYPQLTTKQALLGLAIAKKYHRQLPEELLREAKGEV